MSLAIHQHFAVIQEDDRLIAAGKAANGDILRFCRLGPGVEVQIQPPDGMVKHRCFHSVYAFMCWYQEHYVSPAGVCDGS